MDERLWLFLHSHFNTPWWAARFLLLLEDAVSTMSKCLHWASLRVCLYNDIFIERWGFLFSMCANLMFEEEFFSLKIWKKFASWRYGSLRERGWYCDFFSEKCTNTYSLSPSLSPSPSLNWKKIAKFKNIKKEHKCKLSILQAWNPRSFSGNSKCQVRC